MTHQHYKSDTLRFTQVEFCLPSKAPYKPFVGEIVDLPGHVVPSDIPSPLLDGYVDIFSTQPEQALTQFLEINPNFANPRDLGRILFHTAKLSPFAISVILFNSVFSSRALVFSFMSAIDLDCLSIVDAMRYITQRVAIPTKTIGIVQFASAFATAYELRNQLEWPNAKVVNDVFCAAMIYCVLGGDFLAQTARFSPLKDVSRYILTQIGKELKSNPPAMFFTSVPVFVELSQNITGEIEHEARYRSSWKAYKYSKEDDKIICRDLRDSKKLISMTKLEGVIAHQKVGNSKKPWCLTLQRFDNQEFGQKWKDGQWKDSLRKSYTLSFKTEAEMVLWIAAVNLKPLQEELSLLN